MDVSSRAGQTHAVMNVSELPRILVVTSNNFNLTTGGGITLTNLFRGWPVDRIANVHEDHTSEDRSVCRNFYRLSDEEIRWSWPFSWAQSWRRKARSAFVGEASAGNRTSALSAAGVGGGPFGVRISRRIMGDGMPRTVGISARLRHWLDAFKPELLYGFLGSMAQIRLMQRLSQTLAVPMAVHMMDNWPAVLYRRGLLGPLLRPIVQKEFQALLRGASLRLGICEDMCQEYQRRYGYPFLPFHNALDIEEWLSGARRNWTAGSPFIVRYVGSIVADGQRESLREVCEAVSLLRTQGVPVEMWIHAPREQTAYLLASGVSWQGLHVEDSPPAGAVMHLLAGADLLVLPFNFDARSAEYIRLSMPTKVPAYMVSGTPILVYGPSGIATTRYAEREGWGRVISAGGVPALRKTLLDLMADQAARERLGLRAQALARERHDAARVRPAFQTALAAASRSRCLASR